MSRPQLVIFSGLPGTGKSTLAEYAGRQLHYPVFSKDYLEATLWREGIGQAQRSGWIAQELLNTLALRQLQLGQSAILDTVATFDRMRAPWREAAGAHGADFRVVETICSDEQLHRDRLIGRDRGIPGWHELTWADVEGVRGRFEPWTDARLILDAVQPLDTNVALLRDYLNIRRPAR